ncbi:replication factor C subunit 3-like [Mangifera indica]|uniref:replication factor C subunit 3-like n=1 Tax=Mangifera indica TaxID=29780 RepID=UPI001CF9C49D|nr:replication factor C subunit 3-like [Mangifera indica]
MPSPPIPRSSSPKTPTIIPPPSSRSACSARSQPKLSYRRLGNFIIPGRKSSDSCSKHSDLTEQGLEAHNRRHAPILHNTITAHEKNSKCSPYYKGLTDASLVINRERFASSPGRESHAITMATSSSSSLSSFMLRMQGWSSCFTFKSLNPTTSVPLINHNHPTFSSYSISTKTPTSTSVKEMNLNKAEKPLRERVSESSTTPSRDTNEFVWADKYQPKTLKEFICNRDKVIQLQGLVEEGGCRNFIFEGPPGAGKRTMICAMLREEFGPDTVQTREASMVFDLKGELISSIKVNVKESVQHVEVNVSDLKGYEKHVILELMKEKQSKLSNKGLQSNPDNSKAIILCEADKLSTDTLLYIRWLLERYKGLNKVFFCCSDASKLQPIKSLCTVVQLFPPSDEEIVKVLEFIAKQEGVELQQKFAENFANKSKNNLRQAIRSFEASWQMNYPFKDDQQILTGWEDVITNIAKKIIQEQSPKQLYIIRGKLQNLIEHDVSPEFIFKSLVEELKKHLDVGLHNCIDNLYGDYNIDDRRMFDDEKPFVFARSSRHEEIGKRLNDPVRKNAEHFFKIEEFIAKFMSKYKTEVTHNRSEQQDTGQPHIRSSANVGLI